MGSLSVVVQQLRKERERAQREVHRIDAALAALGNPSVNGASPSRRSMSAAARRKISLLRKHAGQAEDETEANDLGCWAQTDCGSTASTVGKGKERGLKEKTAPDRNYGVLVSQEMDKLKEVRAASYADKWDVPIYTYVEAAYYLGIHRGTLRTWVIGRTIPYKGELRRLDPLIKAADVRSGLMSFYNLAEAHILAASRYKHHVPLRSVRNAIIHLQNRYPSSHPLLFQRVLHGRPRSVHKGNDGH